MRDKFRFTEIETKGITLEDIEFAKKFIQEYKDLEPSYCYISRKNYDLAVKCEIDVEAVAKLAGHKGVRFYDAIPNDILLR